LAEERYRPLAREDWLLALETAAGAASAALYRAGELRGEERIPRERSAAAELLPAIDRLLRAAGIGPAELRAFAVSIGPGSFTGLRIGLATALGLAFGTKRRLVPVPTLAALSLQAEGESLVAPLVDARRGEVYAGLYDASQNPELPDACSSLADWLPLLPSHAPIAFLGSGAQLYRAALAAGLGERARFLPAERGVLKARSVGALGHRLVLAGADLPPEQVELRYLRRAEAEAKRLALQP
jgi:tRNA threonylcarbamoyladenosine biosynthesis protein TsaB